MKYYLLCGIGLCGRSNLGRNKVGTATVIRVCQGDHMSWQHVRMSRFGGPEVLELAEESTIPNPGTGEVRIKVLAAGTGFTDSFIRRGRYPDFKGPLPFTPGYELVGVVEKAGSGVVSPREEQIVADLCVVGGYAQYAIRPARFLVPVPDGVDAAEAVCIPLAYLTAFQMLTRCGSLPAGATILVIGASGAVGGAHFDRSFACVRPGGILIGYGSQTMATGGESLIAAGVGLLRLKLWG